MKLFDTIRAAGGGEIVAALAAKAGIGPDEAEEALRALLPEIGRAIRRTEESGSGAAVVSAAMHDERYARYLEQPETLGEPAAVADGEQVLEDVLDDDERGDLIRRVAAEIGPDEEEVRDPASPRRRACHGGRRREAARPVAQPAMVRHKAGRPVRRAAAERAHRPVRAGRR